MMISWKVVFMEMMLFLYVGDRHGQDDVDIEEDVNLQDLGDVGDNASNDTQDFEQRFDSYDNINLSLDPSSWI
ncbi:hypothetical protein DsansV1_C10g0098671 [Dioscorea sansibarensis]